VQRLAADGKRPFSSLLPHTASLLRLPRCPSTRQLHALTYSHAGGSRAQAFGCASGELVLCNLRAPCPAGGKLHATCVPATASGITACSFAPGGGLLALGCEDGTLVLWSTAAGLKLSSWQLARARISACGFSPDGTMLAVGDALGLLYVWDTQKGLLVQLAR
jgi:WD40 repeat protein